MHQYQIGTRYQPERKAELSESIAGRDKWYQNISCDIKVGHFLAPINCHICSSNS